MIAVVGARPRLADHPAPSGDPVLAAGLAASLGSPPGPEPIHWRLLDTVSTHPIYRGNVRLVDGRAISVIFKRTQRRSGTQVCHEVTTYRTVLAHPRFGAPLLYAADCDSRGGQARLFLEDLGDRRLDRSPIGDWRAAVRWLGWLHGAHAVDPADAASDPHPYLPSILPIQDAAFYWSAGAARSSLEARQGGIALARLDRMLARFAAAIDCLERQPRTLVHGSMLGANVMVEPHGRVRAVDWEKAAIGAGVCDLAKLLEGWTGSRRSELTRCYSESYASHARTALDPAQLKAGMMAAWVLRVLRRVAWWKEPCQDERRLARMIQQAERALIDLEHMASRSSNRRSETEVGASW